MVYFVFLNLSFHIPHLPTMSIAETLTQTKAVFADIAKFLNAHTDAKLLQAPEGKWHSLLQAQHLVISQKSTLVAYKVPGFAVGLLYGKRAGGVSRSYDEIVATYQGHLNNGAKAPAEYVPKAKDFDKARLVASFNKVGTEYLAAVATKTEKELDTLQVKHPLLGKLTLRELAYFTLYHNRHHLKSMQGLV